MKNFIPNRTSQGKQYLIVLAVIVAVSVLCYLCSSFIGYRTTAFVLFVTVSIIAMLFDIYPVLLAALLSALIWDFFFIPPHFTFHVSSTEDVTMLLMYFVIASVSAVLTYKIRQISKIARDEEEKANAVKLYNILLNSLSHELRTPISTIIGASDNLLHSGEKISEVNKRKLLEEIGSASLRLDKQVENLLSMSRLESGFIQPRKDWCDVHELVHSVVNQLDETLKVHTVKIQIPDELPLFRLDFGLMQQVLNNLLNNAAIHIPKGAVITITASTRKKGKNEFLIIEVQDNGPGFPESETEKVFEKFYRLSDSRTGGTGLGLSIVKGLVEAHGGSVTLRNNYPGASFLLEIPSETSYLKQTEK